MSARALVQSRHVAIAAACVVFLGWFSMRFHMDNSNDSETDAYVASLVQAAARLSFGTDATGHATGLVPYVVWPFTVVLQPFTGIYLIRGFVFVYLLLATALYGAAYAWYRELGLGWLTALLGLVLLSTGAAFALMIRGWELDKLLEPTLFLLVAITAWRGQYALSAGLVLLAVLNRETGAFAALVVVAAAWRDAGSLRLALTRRPVWAAVLMSVMGFGLLRALAVPAVSLPDAVGANLTFGRIVYIVGGLCLTPLFAVAWMRSSERSLQRLLVLLAPAWVALVSLSDRLEQGAVLLTLTALLFVPMSLVGLERMVREQVRFPGEQR